MKTQVVASAAINALKEALASVYWYKSDLRSFLHHCLSDPQVLSRLNWDDYKRNIVSTLVDYLAANPEVYLGDLLRLMSEVVKIDDFSHLERLEDGKEKAKRANEAVVALRKLYMAHEDIVLEHKKIEERRQAAYKERLRNQAVNDKLAELQTVFFQLLSSKNPQSRGFELEKILRELFQLFDLDPKASFRNIGEQIDGAFTLEGTDYLLECKWQDKPVGIDELDAFSGKVSRKLDNTLGLFVSINGFSDDGVRAHSRGRPTMILMDGSDLMAVLEGRIDLVQLLTRKRRHASQTGNIYLRIHEILA